MDLYFAMSKMTKYFNNCSYPLAVLWVCILNDFLVQQMRFIPLLMTISVRFIAPPKLLILYPLAVMSSDSYASLYLSVDLSIIIY